MLFNIGNIYRINKELLDSQFAQFIIIRKAQESAG